jgi:hypothetical protein
MLFRLTKQSLRSEIGKLLCERHKIVVSILNGRARMFVRPKQQRAVVASSFEEQQESYLVLWNNGVRVNSMVKLLRADGGCLGTPRR